MTAETNVYRYSLRLTDDTEITREMLESSAKQAGLSINDYIIRMLAKGTSNTDLQDILEHEQLQRLISILVQEKRDFKAFFRDTVQRYIDRY